MGNLRCFQGRGEAQTSRHSSDVKPPFLIIKLQNSSSGFMLLQTQQQQQSVSFPMLGTDSPVPHNAGVPISNCVNRRYLTQRWR